MAPGLASGGAWINHYAFQSRQRWEAKKVRGRTNRHAPRTGEPPAFYSSTEDLEGALSVLRRVKAVRDAPLHGPSPVSRGTRSLALALTPYPQP